MIRITPEEVLEAYQATGLKPMRGEYFPKEGCACGLGAYVSNNDFEEGQGDVEDMLERLGIVDSYRAGFANGFDGVESKNKREEWNIGWIDGKSAWEVVKHLALE